MTDLPAHADPAEMVTPQELADRCRVPVTTVYRWNHSGTGPAYMKLGRHVRYARAEVDRWLAERVTSAADLARRRLDADQAAGRLLADTRNHAERLAGRTAPRRDPDEVDADVRTLITWLERRGWPYP